MHIMLDKLDREKCFRKQEKCYIMLGHEIFDRETTDPQRFKFCVQFLRI